MTSDHIVGIGLNVLVFVAFALAFFVFLQFWWSENRCLQEQSPSCPTISCPADDKTKAPNFGTAFRKTSSGSIQYAY